MQGPKAEATGLKMLEDAIKKAGVPLRYKRQTCRWPSAKANPFTQEPFRLDKKQSSGGRLTPMAISAWCEERDLCGWRP